jgi:hypothetical protein
VSDLTNREIRLVVHDYIGVQSGYLGDFSYRTHRDFYPDYCDGKNQGSCRVKIHDASELRVARE